MLFQIIFAFISRITSYIRSTSAPIFNGFNRFQPICTDINRMATILYEFKRSQAISLNYVITNFRYFKLFWSGFCFDFTKFQWFPPSVIIDDQISDLQWFTSTSSNFGLPDYKTLETVFGMV